MEFLFLLLVVGFVVWISAFGGKKKVNNSSKTGSSNSDSQKLNSSAVLAFQAAGTSPKTDSAGRVIVKLKGSSAGLSWGVNLSKLDQPVAKKLAGRVTEDEDFSKNIKVRIRPDSNSQYKNSVLVETVDERFIGWLLKDFGDQAISVLSQVEAALVKSASELSGSKFTFEVSAKIEGYWNDESEDDKPDWFVDVQDLIVQIKIPAQVEVD